MFQIGCFSGKYFVAACTLTRFLMHFHQPSPSISKSNNLNFLFGNISYDTITLNFCLITNKYWLVTRSQFEFVSLIFMDKPILIISIVIILVDAHVIVHLLNILLILILHITIMQILLKLILEFLYSCWKET